VLKPTSTVYTSGLKAQPLQRMNRTRLWGASQENARLARFSIFNDISESIWAKQKSGCGKTLKSFKFVFSTLEFLC